MHGEGIEPHRHRLGQLLYPSAGVLATTTERGTCIAPSDRIAWTPPHFEHHSRSYGEAEIRILEIPVWLCRALPLRPSVLAVSPLCRESILVLTGDRPLAREREDRLRRVVIDELTGVPEESVYLPEARDDRLRSVTGLLHADPADSSTLIDLGRRVGASDRTLSRLFQAQLGMSFHQWRTLLRVQHALIHLSQGETVTGTALRVGWANPTSFIEAFTTLIGQTPGRYRAGLERIRG